MIRLVNILLTVLALSFYVRGEASAAYNHKEVAAVTNAPADNGNSDRDRLRHADLTEQPTPVALLTNGQQGHRLSTSRPQRLMPVYGSKSKRDGAKGLLSIKNKTFIHCQYGARGAHLSSPLPVRASCLYYVYALRRIIR